MRRLILRLPETWLQEIDAIRAGVEAWGWVGPPSRSAMLRALIRCGADLARQGPIDLAASIFLPGPPKSAGGAKKRRRR